MQILYFIFIEFRAKGKYNIFKKYIPIDNITKLIIKEKGLQRCINLLNRFFFKLIFI